MRRLIPCLLATLVLAACQPNGDAAAPASTAAAPAAANESRHAFQDAISAEDFAAHVERIGHKVHANDRRPLAESFAAETVERNLRPGA